MMNVEMKILDERVRIWGAPNYKSEMAAAIDLCACIDDDIEIWPGEKPNLISTGIAIHIADPNVAAFILPRSGMGHRQGLVLGNLVGLIDPDYTGPLMVSAWNRSPDWERPLILKPGERFAQLIFLPIIRPEFNIVDEFSALSVRGEGGFGSTGR